MRNGLLAMLWLGAAAPCVLAQGGGAQTASAAPDPELAALLAVLQEETAVATKTRMNSDFVPGLVTVLHGDELLSMGAETVWEALSLVPGLYAVRDRGGTPSVIVRGTEFPFNSGNVKVLVNGVALSREAAGINGIVLQIPLQQVDRIEVIRGPGSVVHGDFAFMGLVNIVTRPKGTHVHLRYGGDEALSGGVHAAGKVGGWEMGLTAGGLTNDHAPFALPNEGEEDRAWGTASVRRGGLSVTAQGIRRNWESAAAGQTATPQKQQHWALDGRYGRDLGGGLRLEARAAYKDNLFSTATSRFDGDDVDLGVDLHGQRGRHAWLAGVGYNRGRIDEAIQRPPAPPGGTPVVRSILDGRRNVWSATLQDRFDVAPSLSLTAGGRFDDYSDIGDRRITPRASIVWRASDKNILKLQHAEGFRAPAFFELYAAGTANQDLGFEVNATTELNYVHRRPHTVARATLFRSRIRNMTFIVPNQNLFESVKSGQAHGVELEWEQQLGSALKVLANASWVDQQDNRTPAAIARRSPAGAEWLANVGLLWRVLPATVLAAHWNHVGRPGETADTRGYDLLDVAATRHDLLGTGIQARGGVKNAFNADVRYIGVRPNGDLDIGHFPRRTYWVQLAWNR